MLNFLRMKMFPIHSGSAEHMKIKANNFIFLKELPIFNVSYRSLFGILVKKYQNWRYTACHAFDFTHTSNLWSHLQCLQGFLSTTLVPLQTAGERYGVHVFSIYYIILYLWSLELIVSPLLFLHFYSHGGPTSLQKAQINKYTHTRMWGQHSCTKYKQHVQCYSKCCSRF